MKDRYHEIETNAFQHLAESEAEDLLRRLQHQTKLQELRGNPLLVTMIANVHNDSERKG